MTCDDCEHKGTYSCPLETFFPWTSWRALCTEFKQRKTMTFPYYFKHSGGEGKDAYETRCAVCENGLIEITKCSDWKYSIDVIPYRKPEDYGFELFYGNDKYKSSKEEFDEFLLIFAEKLNEIKA